MKRPKILLIDDDELFLSLTKNSLKSSSYIKRIKCINHVKDAREYLDSCISNNRNFPDIIFLDINMPGIGGLDFAELYSRKYSEIFPETKLVILSYSNSWKDKENAMKISGVAEFVQKPLTQEKVQKLFHD